VHQDLRLAEEEVVLVKDLCMASSCSLEPVTIFRLLSPRVNRFPVDFESQRAAWIWCSIRAARSFASVVVYDEDEEDPGILEWELCLLPIFETSVQLLIHAAKRDIGRRRSQKLNKKRPGNTAGLQIKYLRKYSRRTRLHARARAYLQMYHVPP